MRCDGLIFDLDGTLWDTNATCAQVWNRVVAQLGISYRTISEADIRGVAGQPHVTAVRSVFTDVSESDVQRIAEKTATEDNAAIAKLGGRLFPGVFEHIPSLASERPLMIVSNCQRGYIEIFLRTSGLAQHFADYECWGNTGRSKAENLGAVIERNRLAHAMFVGDTEGDWQAARENKVPFVYATYGFGRTPEVEHRIDRFEDIGRLFD